MYKFMVYVALGFAVGLVSMLLNWLNPTLMANKVTIEFSMMDALLLILGVVIVNKLFF
jgi:hypothetical protein